MSQRLKRMKERLKRATDGPYNVKYNDGYWTVTTNGTVVAEMRTISRGGHQNRADAEFLAHAWSDLHWLINRYEEQQIELNYVKRELKLTAKHLSRLKMRK